MALFPSLINRKVHKNIRLLQLADSRGDLPKLFSGQMAYRDTEKVCARLVMRTAYSDLKLLTPHIPI